MIKIISFLKKFKKVAEHLIILILYTVITILIFYPITLNFHSYFPGISVDVLANSWYFWLPRGDLLYSDTDFLHIDYLAYPHSSNLFINSIFLWNVIIYSPVEWFFRLPFTYNLNIFLSFIISGYTTFLLARYVTQDSCASFIAGLIFTFSPFRIYRIIMGHINLTATEFIPLYIIFLLKFIKEVNLKNSLLLALLFIINVYSSIYISFVLMIFTLIIIFLNVRKIFIFKNLKYIILVLTISLISIFPYIYAFISEGNKYFTFKSLNFASKYSADLFAFIFPSSFNLFWGDYLKNYVNVTWSEHFIGYTVIIILIYGLIRGSGNKVWLTAGICFFVLSLGPTLKIMDKTGDNIFFFYLDDLKVTVPLPYIILYYICPLIRVPGRFTMFMILSIAILCAYSLKDFFQRFSRRKIFITTLLTIFILVEFSVDMPVTKVNVPEIYYRIEKEKEDFTILEIPLFIVDGWHHIGVYDNTVQYYQTIHNKKILNAYLSRLPESLFYYYSNIPVIGTIIGLEENSKIEKNRIEIDRIWVQRVLHFFNIKYIIFHPPFNNSTVKDYMKDMMNLKAIDTGIPEVYEVFREEIELSSINIDINEPASLLYMLEGWEWYEENGNYYYKSNLKKSIVMVPLDNNISYNMILFLSASENSSMTVMLNGQELGKIKLTDKECKYEFSLSGYKFKRLNKFEFIQKNFQKEKVFLKVRQINFSTNK
jgi:hypothetical protein